jgi:hypothetical protein
MVFSGWRANGVSPISARHAHIPGQLATPRHSTGHHKHNGVTFAPHYPLFAPIHRPFLHPASDFGDADQTLRRPRFARPALITREQTNFAIQRRPTTTVTTVWQWLALWARFGVFSRVWASDLWPSSRSVGVLGHGPQNCRPKGKPHSSAGPTAGGPTVAPTRPLTRARLCGQLRSKANKTVG